MNHLLRHDMMRNIHRRVGPLLLALATAGAQAQAKPPSLSSLEYVWGVAADATDICPRLPEPWRQDCQRGAEGLRNVVLACAGVANVGSQCAQWAREAAELGDALKFAVLAIDGESAVCTMRKDPPGRCADLEHSQTGLASIKLRILRLEKTL